MGSRYVPPHLRRKSSESTADELAGNRDDREAEPLARRRLSDLRISTTDERPLYTIHELNRHYGSTLTHSTLRDSSSRPGQLGFVVLFNNANPRWKSDHIVFAHTNIHILPGYQELQKQLEKEKATKYQSPQLENDSTDGRIIDGNNVVGLDPASGAFNENLIPDEKVAPSPVLTSSTISETQPGSIEIVSTDLVPIFMEVHRRKDFRRLAFQGYFRLTRVDFLKPQSIELVRMLQQKWEPMRRNSNMPPSRSKERDHVAWAKSMSHEWAVLQFRPVPETEAPEVPQIEVLLDEEQHSGPVVAGDSVDVSKADQGVE